MKPIKCSKCGKTVNVEDNWQYKRCEICRTKDIAYKQVLKDKRRLDRESRNKIKELKLEGKALRFGEWEKIAKEKFNNPKPTWEQYDVYLKQRKEREIFSKAEREIYRLKAENQQKYRLICQDLFPLSHGRECYAFRLSRLNGSRDIRHLSSCEDCSDWNYNFENDMLPALQDERDDSEPVDPIEKWELEQWRKRGATVPDDSLDRLKPKQEPENRDPSQISYQPIRQQEPSQNEPRPEQPSEPLDPQEYIDQTFNNRKKKREQSETNTKEDQNND